MYNDTHPPTNSRLQVSAVQVLMIVALVWGVVILPIQFMELQKVTTDAAVYTPEALHAQTQVSEAARVAADENSQGRVAGASTSADSNIIKIPGTSIQFQVNDELGILIVVGSSLLAFGGLVSIYLLLTRTRLNTQTAEIDYYLL